MKAELTLPGALVNKIAEIEVDSLRRTAMVENRDMRWINNPMPACKPLIIVTLRGVCA